MKKMLFGLIATVLFSVSGNAQSKLTVEQKSVVSAQMVVLVHGAKANYSKNMTLPEWIKQTGPYNPTSNEKILLTKMYDYVSKGVTDCEIMKSDNSILLNIVKEGGFSPSPSVAGKWCWSCIGDFIIRLIEILAPILVP
jgi:hypothetical protein